MKARWTMACEHCRETIPVGAQYVMFHGRPWITKHVIAYQKQRRDRGNEAASLRK
jgi:hypothetical protein